MAQSMCSCRALWFPLWGRGIAADLLAGILESRGIKVTILKLDPPYINVDPGPMRPLPARGEVFVKRTGAETDLDRGHSERSSRRGMHRNKTTSPPARYYDSVIKKGAGRGDYLGPQHP